MQQWIDHTQLRYELLGYHPQKKVIELQEEGKEHRWNCDG